MIYANEAKKIAKESAKTNELHNLVVEVLPMVENEIRNSANYGQHEILIKKETIIKELGNRTIFFAHKDIMNALADEIREYGFDTEIPNSYSSIHIYW